MSTADIAVQSEIVERLITSGDVSKLSPDDRARYYAQVCNSLGLNPLTQPFEYVVLQGKMRLYARKDATEQLRRIYKVSLAILSKEVIEGSFSVHVKATMPDGRCDEDVGIVSIAGLKGEAQANAMLKAITKAKRRATLSICGLGFLDETEVETIPGAVVAPVEQAALPANGDSGTLRDAKRAMRQQSLDTLNRLVDQVAAHTGKMAGEIVQSILGFFGLGEQAELTDLNGEQLTSAIRQCESKLKKPKAVAQPA